MFGIFRFHIIPLSHHALQLTCSGLPSSPTTYLFPRWLSVPTSLVAVRQISVKFSRTNSTPAVRLPPHNNSVPPTPFIRPNRISPVLPVPAFSFLRFWYIFFHLNWPHAAVFRPNSWSGKFLYIVSDKQYSFSLVDVLVLGFKVCFFFNLKKKCWFLWILLGFMWSGFWFNLIFIGFLILFLGSLLSGNLKEDKRGEKKMTWALFECWFDFIWTSFSLRLYCKKRRKMILFFRFLEFKSKWELGKLDPFYVNVQKSFNFLLFSLSLLFCQKLRNWYLLFWFLKYCVAILTEFLLIRSSFIIK